MEQPEPLPLVCETLALLATGFAGREMRGWATVTSTNRLAAEWAAAGAAEGSVVAAEFQTQGRGRLGRTWRARPGLNLTFSVILRPALPPDLYGLITLAAGVAVAETIERFVQPNPARIKWPNDVLLEGRKCCGMLLEASLPARPDARPAVVLGIGLNVNQDEFPAELADRATSLLLVAGRPVPRPPLFAALLAALEAHYLSLAEDGGASVRRRYTARLQGLGQPATLRFADASAGVTGLLLGITETGALRMQVGGAERTFHAGEVTFR